jgi:hypothetical protein
MNKSFHGATNLKMNAIDAHDLSETTNSNEKQVIYDFSKIHLMNLGTHPRAIVEGLDNNKETNLWVHIPKKEEQFQIRMSAKRLWTESP